MQFLVEVWTLWGIGMAVLATRYAVRIKLVGLRGLQGDDFFSLLVVIFYTMDAWTVHLVCESLMASQTCEPGAGPPGES